MSFCLSIYLSIYLCHFIHIYMYIYVILGIYYIYIFIYINQIFHAFLFNIRNYSPKIYNDAKRILLPRVNNFDIKQKRHGIFV